MRPKRYLLNLLLVLLLAVLLLALGASGAQAAHRVHLQPTNRIAGWQSPQSLPADRGFYFAIYRAGRELEKRGFLAGNCHYMLAVPALLLTLSSCGNSPLTVRYASSQPLTLFWWMPRVVSLARSSPAT